MIDHKHSESVSLIFTEFDSDAKLTWFNSKQKKFLHNIDTFYYSVKFDADFTSDSNDNSVKAFRRYFSDLQNDLYVNFDSAIELQYSGVGSLMLMPYSFSKFYSICLEKTDMFDIFLAPRVPKGSGNTSVTCECLIQVRSYMLWLYGIETAFEMSFKYVQAIADHFSLPISFVQENRVDFAWHSNYFGNPEKYFAIDNFYKMRVDRYKGAVFNTEKVGSENYLIDYIALGKRGQKCFVRIYLKSKEVVEMGYKSFFFKIWKLHGLINAYDLFCYESAFKRGNWSYMTIARLEFYAAYGANEFYRSLCRTHVNACSENIHVTDDMLRLADQLTPKNNLVVNLEFQTMRKSSKTFQLMPFRDNSHAPVKQRVYDYFDNLYIIGQYLTKNILRLVETTGDSNKARRPDNNFWKRLRKTKMLDTIVPKDEIALVRDYSRKLNLDVIKRSILNKSIVHGFYCKGDNSDTPVQDLMQAMLTLNDNDVQNAVQYKIKKSKHINFEEMSGLSSKKQSCNYTIVNNQTGETYDYNNINDVIGQDSHDF